MSDDRFEQTVQEVRNRVDRDVPDVYIAAATMRAWTQVSQEGRHGSVSEPQPMRVVAMACGALKAAFPITDAVDQPPVSQMNTRDLARGVARATATQVTSRERFEQLGSDAHSATATRAAVGVNGRAERRTAQAIPGFTDAQREQLRRRDAEIVRDQQVDRAITELLATPRNPAPGHGG